MNKINGLRLEIVVSLSLVVGAALLFGGLLLLRLAEQQLVEQRVVALTALARSISTASLDDGDSDPRLRSYRAVVLVKALQGDVAPESWTVVDAGLVPLATLQSGSETPSASADLRLARNSAEPVVKVRYAGSWLPFFVSEVSNVLVTVPLVAPARFDGALQLVFSLESVRARIHRSQRLVLAYVALYGTVLIGFGSYLLGRNVVQPVRQLLLATQAVTAGDLSQQLPVSGPGEVAELAADFNRMLEALRQSRHETETHIATLEQVNAELRVARRELLRSERLASVGHLAAGMAHEIGNPLGAIVGYLDLLRRELRDPAAIDLVERSLTEAGRIDRLVRDLLDFSAPERDSQGCADPGQVLAEALLLLTRQGKFDNIAINTDLPTSLPAVPVSDHKLQQVVVNLLLNACDAMPGGGMIEMSGAVVDGMIRLCIFDSGSGIPEEVQAKMFDPFYSTKPEGKGRGLGLAICHRIVEEAGGRIEVASGPAGTTFSVLLPCAEVASGR